VVNDDVRGSIHVAEGGTVVVNGDVGGHVAVRGGRAVINGDVGGAVHAHCASIVVNGTAGSQVITSGGGCSITIAGDLTWG
jgi:formylmethanofuran dehydrogenase subunit C